MEPPTPQKLTKENSISTEDEKCTAEVPHIQKIITSELAHTDSGYESSTTKLHITEPSILREIYKTINNRSYSIEESLEPEKPLEKLINSNTTSETHILNIVIENNSVLDQVTTVTSAEPIDNLVLSKIPKNTRKSINKTAYAKLQRSLSPQRNSQIDSIKTKYEISDTETKSMKKDENSNEIPRKSSSSSGEFVTIVTRPKSIETIDFFEKELNLFTMGNKPLEKKRTSSFKKLFKGKIFSKEKKKKEDTVLDNKQNEQVPPEVPTRNLQEIEKQYAQMHINEFNNIQQNFENQYVKYIDSSSSSSIIDTNSTTIDNSFKNNRFTDVSRETPPRAQELHYQNVKLVNPKALIPINSHRPLPNPYQKPHVPPKPQNLQTTTYSNAEVSPTHLKSYNLEHNQDSEPYKTKTEYQTSSNYQIHGAQNKESNNYRDEIQIASKSEIDKPTYSETVSKPERVCKSPSLEPSKLRLPANRDIGPLSPRLRSPIPQYNVSTEKLIATELLRTSRSPTPTKKKIPDNTEYGSKIPVAKSYPKTKNVTTKESEHFYADTVVDSHFIYPESRKTQNSRQNEEYRNDYYDEKLSTGNSRLSRKDRAVTSPKMFLYSNESLGTSNRLGSDPRNIDVTDDVYITNEMAQSSRKLRSDPRRSVNNDNVAYSGRPLSSSTNLQNVSVGIKIKPPVPKRVESIYSSKSEINSSNIPLLQSKTKSGTNLTGKPPVPQRYSLVSHNYENVNNYYPVVPRDIRQSRSSETDVGANEYQSRNYIQTSNGIYGSRSRENYDSNNQMQVPHAGSTIGSQEIINISPIHPQTSRSSTPVELRHGSTNKPQSPQKEEMRRSVEAYYWKEIKKLKDQEDQYLYYYYQDPVYYTRRSNRSLSLPRESKEAYIRYQPTAIPEGRAVTYPHYQQNFKRNTPERRTIEVLPKSTNSINRPIFKRGSLTTPVKELVIDDQQQKKVTFNNSRRLDDDVFLPPAQTSKLLLDGKEVYQRKIDPSYQNVTRYNSVQVIDPSYEQHKRISRRMSFDNPPRRQIFIQDEVYGYFGDYIPSSPQQYNQNISRRVPMVREQVCDIYGVIHDRDSPSMNLRNSGVVLGQLQTINDANFVRNSRLTSSANDMYNRRYYRNENQDLYGRYSMQGEEVPSRSLPPVPADQRITYRQSRR